MSACSGGKTQEAQFDTNDDDMVNIEDILDDDESDTNPPDDSPGGKEFDHMLYKPIQVGPNLIINDSSGDPPNQVKIPENLEGLYYWRVVN